MTAFSASRVGTVEMRRSYALFAHLNARAAVLRTHAVGDVELAQHLDARDDAIERRHRQRHVLAHHAVDAEANHAALRAARLDVDVAHALHHGVAENEVRQLDERRGIDVLLRDFLRLRFLEHANRVGERGVGRVEQILDGAIGGVGAGRGRPRWTRARELEVDAASTGEADVALGLVVLRFARGDGQLAVGLAECVDAMLLGELLRNQARRIGFGVVEVSGLHAQHRRHLRGEGTLGQPQHANELLPCRRSRRILRNVRGNRARNTSACRRIFQPVNHEIRSAEGLCSHELES